jgi:hypothetical protein
VGVAPAAKMAVVIVFLFVNDIHVIGVFVAELVFLKASPGEIRQGDQEDTKKGIGAENNVNGLWSHG